MPIKKLLCFMILSLGLTSLAFAHPSQEHGNMNALLHPFTGVDHFLMALVVGFLISRTVKFKISLPVVFLSGMILGFLSTEVSHNELGIILSLGLAGILLLSPKKLSLNAILPVIALSGFFHGNAHGTEMAAGYPVLTVMELVLGTAFIHLFGLFIVRLSGQYKYAVIKVSGAAVMAAGFILLMKAL